MQGSLDASEPTESNATSVVSEDDAEEPLANMNLTTFKERFRRLIPYMTFYVANNYLQNQAALTQNYANELLRKPPPPPPPSPHHSLIRLGGSLLPRRIGNKYRINLSNQEAKKFVPSVQFDPRNIGGDNDYFAPVKYATKIVYADSPYQFYQAQKTYPEITTPPSSQILYKDNRYFPDDRPVRLPVREQHLAKKPPIRPQNDYEHNDYGIARPPSVSYVNKDFESLRYVQPNVHQQLVKSPAVAQIYRKPSVNLNNIIEAYQQTERLPEILNKDNIDENIKTLVEILNILHNTRQEDFPQLPGLPLPLLPPPSPPSLPPRLIGYNNGYNRVKTYTRPKVITETRFQVTPNPLLITDDPERYKTTEDADVSNETPLRPNYNNVDNVRDEYYVPYVQGGPDEHEQGFRPIASPETEQHSYEITEDLSDDIPVDDGRYAAAPSTSTEASSNKGHAAPNEVIRHPKPKVPQTSSKYGATRGKPHIDYPAYATIPETNFSCKDQRYKGFFGDPASGCQVSIKFSARVDKKNTVTAYVCYLFVDFSLGHSVTRSSCRIFRFFQVHYKFINYVFFVYDIFRDTTRDL